MSNLEKAKEFIARGEKENAAALLASMLLTDKNDLEAWLLLGDAVDDPSRRKLCYNQVLKLSPQNVQALSRLRELEGSSAAFPPTEKSEAGEVDDENAVTQPRIKPNFVPVPNFTPPANESKGSAEIVGYVIGGIAAFFVILYVLGTGAYSSTQSNTLCIGLVLLSLIAGIIVVSVSSRGKA
jgi:hypothetical protein